MDGILLLSGIITCVVGAAFAPLAVHFTRRQATEPAYERAMRFFALWWASLALNHVLSGLVYSAAALGWTSLEVQLTLALVNRILLCTSLVGLLAYVLFVATGRDRWPWLATVYGAYLILTIDLLYATRPDHVLVLGWRTVVEGSVAGPRWGDILAILVVVLPPLVGGILFARTARRASSRTARRRGALVGYVLMGWWVLTVAAGNVATYTSFIQPLNRVVGLGLAVAALLAYAPHSIGASSDAGASSA